VFISTDTFLTVSGIPYVFSCVAKKTRENSKSTYRFFKRQASCDSSGASGLIESRQLAKNIFSSKLKAYGYKSFFARAAEPSVSVLVLPM